MDDNAIQLLKQEMQCEEIHVKVNAIHRLKTVIMSIDHDDITQLLIPYLKELIK